MNPALIAVASLDGTRRFAASIAAAALVAVSLLLAPSPLRAECPPAGAASITSLPDCPTPTDSVTVHVDGWFPDGCWSPLVLDSSRVENDGIRIYATAEHAGGERFCAMYIVGYEFEVRVPPLPPGRHPVWLTMNILSKGAPSEFEGTYLCSSEVKVYTPGDLDASGSRTVSDIISLVIHLFKGGPAPACNSGDVNCDGKLTAADLIVYIIYAFRSGILPNHCGP